MPAGMTGYIEHLPGAAQSQACVNNISALYARARLRNGLKRWAEHLGAGCRTQLGKPAHMVGMMVGD